MKRTTHKSKRFVSGVVSNVAGYINGSTNDTHGVGRVFWATLTREVFKRLHASYEIRSEGGTDDLGNSFAPLKRETIAKRPIQRGSLSGLKLDKRSSGTSLKDRKRGLLTPSEDREWKKIYSRKLRNLILFKPESVAKNIAAAIAWKEMKERGVKTKLDVLGSRDVLIMRVTDKIFNSLEPSGGGVPYRPKKNQLVDKNGTTLTLGTLVEYAKYHNKTRPVIPEDIQSWVADSIDIALEEAIEHLMMKVT